ncbi:hypothetical protein NC653_001730 [Populus alba x Populus x berolinensis]|uniref:Uncharacterized protein n=1 Tax=Populus alba x Populus x berolinensis TaxID=444605 RepID=A0AAD6WFZ2_9ROSI|nr:hypothetical protein NC653_001730 [Populus alba x Populus x berolinensis]
MDDPPLVPLVLELWDFLPSFGRRQELLIARRSSTGEKRKADAPSEKAQVTMPLSIKSCASM